MKGAYCLVLNLPRQTRIRVGALGTVSFPAGVYVYVGSALSGVEQRLARHARKTKKKRWHVDYLMDKAAVLHSIATPSHSKQTECAIARTLLDSDSARMVVKGFGSSDCGCETHLIYFGTEEPAWISETVTRAVAMLSCAYPFRIGTGRE